MSKVIVIGGGASGLIAAIYAKNSTNEVIMLEKNNTCGKKILITGNGRCNYWNDEMTLNHFYSTNPEILSRIITPSSQDKILPFFNSIGIIPKIKDGYYYPNSNQATSIQTALITEATIKGVKILTSEEVIAVKKQGEDFIITTTSQKLTAQKVILATGGLAAPKTGSTGFGYTIAKKLGHQLVKPLPALVQLKSNSKFLKDWQGIRMDAKLSLYENNHLIKEEVGEVQLTSYGISGICTFQLSGLVARGLSKNNEELLKINFLTSVNLVDEKEGINWLENRNNILTKRTISQLLDGILNYKLVNLICKLAKIDKDNYWQNLSKKDKQNLSNLLINFPLPISEVNSFDEAQVTSGGISLTEINPSTLESKKVPNLYFTGELLDVNGDCGGYNLGFAWITGMLAGSAINRSRND